MERAKARAETVLEEEAVRERSTRRADIFGIERGRKVKGACWQIDRVTGARELVWLQPAIQTHDFFSMGMSKAPRRVASPLQIAPGSCPLRDLSDPPRHELSSWSEYV
jgi:hypothetical protein